MKNPEWAHIRLFVKLLTRYLKLGLGTPVRQSSWVAQAFQPIARIWGVFLQKFMENLEDDRSDLPIYFQISRKIDELTCTTLLSGCNDNLIVYGFNPITSNINSAVHELSRGLISKLTGLFYLRAKYNHEPAYQKLVSSLIVMVTGLMNKFNPQDESSVSSYYTILSQMLQSYDNDTIITQVLASLTLLLRSNAKSASSITIEGVSLPQYVQQLIRTLIYHVFQRLVYNVNASICEESEGTEDEEWNGAVTPALKWIRLFRMLKDCYPDEISGVLSELINGDLNKSSTIQFQGLLYACAITGLCSSYADIEKALEYGEYRGVSSSWLIATVAFCSYWSLINGAASSNTLQAWLHLVTKSIENAENLQLKLDCTFVIRNILESPLLDLDERDELLALVCTKLCQIMSLAETPGDVWQVFRALAPTLKLFSKNPDLLAMMLREMLSSFESPYDSAKTIALANYIEGGLPYLSEACPDIAELFEKIITICIKLADSRPSALQLWNAFLESNLCQLVSVKSLELFISVFPVLASAKDNETSAKLVNLTENIIILELCPIEQLEDPLRYAVYKYESVYTLDSQDVIIACLSLTRTVATMFNSANGSISQLVSALKQKSLEHLMRLSLKQDRNLVTELLHTASYLAQNDPSQVIEASRKSGIAREILMDTWAQAAQEIDSIKLLFACVVGLLSLLQFTSLSYTSKFLPKLFELLSVLPGWQIPQSLTSKASSSPLLQRRDVIQSLTLNTYSDNSLILINKLSKLVSYHQVPIENLKDFGIPDVLIEKIELSLQQQQENHMMSLHL